MQIRHGYDLAGNRIYREDVLAAAQGTPVHLDELYAYDGLHRLDKLQRGNVNTSALTLSSESWEEEWLLDPLGNWTGYDQEVNNADTLNQSRTHDEANEITAITGGSWTTPVHDPSGNMTTIPQPNDPANGYTAT